MFLIKNTCVNVAVLLRLLWRKKNVDHNINHRARFQFLKICFVVDFRVGGCRIKFNNINFNRQPKKKMLAQYVAIDSFPSGDAGRAITVVVCGVWNGLACEAFDQQH